VDTENTSSVSQLSCPKCGSADIRRSKNEGVVAAFLRIFGRWPYRCRSCRSRFYLVSAAPDDEDFR
jgi:predicted RNA-binding Zn-ribbon protein involved in translation (DUF1610 family)